jgi:4'-phosphopantetheinyl transferase
MFAPHVIHVWTVPLDGVPPPVALPPGEIARIDAGHPRMRRHRRFVRAVVRTLIGQYLDRDPAALRFLSGDGGKPRLVGDELAFNLSHSDDLMLIAIATGRAVGIDVDRLDRLGDDWRGVSRVACATEEEAALSTLPPGERGPAVMRLWIRKEAYTKARGSGFAHGFPAVTVGFAARGAASRVRDRTDQVGGGRWSLVDLPIAWPMAAALAFAGGHASITHRRYPQDAIGGVA